MASSADLGEASQVSELVLRFILGVVWLNAERLDSQIKPLADIAEVGFFGCGSQVLCPR